jgi:DNA-directed RNA polymerase specialized sigma24 family protein
VCYFALANAANKHKTNGAQFQTYAGTAIRNALITASKLRKKHSKVRHLSDPAIEIEIGGPSRGHHNIELVDPAESTIDSMVRQEDERWQLSVALGAMTYMERRVLIWHTLDGKTFKDMARDNGLTYQRYQQLYSLAVTKAMAAIQRASRLPASFRLKLKTDDLSAIAA